MKILDKKIVLYKDALQACRRRQIVGCDVSKDVEFLNRKLKQFKKERKLL